MPALGRAPIEVGPQWCDVTRARRPAKRLCVVKPALSARPMQKRAKTAIAAIVANADVAGQRLPKAHLQI
jgi:hypothetical protein